jgi:hypothetical protein
MVATVKIQSPQEAFQMSIPKCFPVNVLLFKATKKSQNQTPTDAREEQQQKNYGVGRTQFQTKGKSKLR